MHRRRLLPVRCAQTIGARVAAADNHDVLARGQNLIGNLVAGANFVLLRQKLHGKVNAPQVPARHWQIARLFSAASQQDGIELPL